MTGPEHYRGWSVLKGTRELARRAARRHGEVQDGAR